MRGAGGSLCGRRANQERGPARSHAPPGEPIKGALLPGVGHSSSLLLPKDGRTDGGSGAGLRRGSLLLLLLFPGLLLRGSRSSSLSSGSLAKEEGSLGKEEGSAVDSASASASRLRRMTLEEEAAAAAAAPMALSPKRRPEDGVGPALERLLAAAQAQRCLTLGVYEAAKLMNADPDCVVLCLLATDEEEEAEEDVALQIHFTLIQAFCRSNDIDVLRVSGLDRLGALLAEGANDGPPGEQDDRADAEPRDLHCILLTNPPAEGWKSQGLAEVASFCQDCRGNNRGVPCVSLRAR